MAQDIKMKITDEQLLALILDFNKSEIKRSIVDNYVGNKIKINSFACKNTIIGFGFWQSSFHRLSPLCASQTNKRLADLARKGIIKKVMSRFYRASNEDCLNQMNDAKREWLRLGVNEHVLVDKTKEMIDFYNL